VRWTFKLYIQQLSALAVWRMSKPIIIYVDTFSATPATFVPFVDFKERPQHWKWIGKFKYHIHILLNGLHIFLWHMLGEFSRAGRRWHIVASSSDWFLVLFASVVTLSSAEVLDFRCAKWVRARKPKGCYLLLRLYSLFQRILSVRKTPWASAIVRAVVIGPINFLSFGFSTELKIAWIFCD